jgi:hypothetical protein
MSLADRVSFIMTPAMDEQHKGHRLDSSVRLVSGTAAGLHRHILVHSIILPIYSQPDLPDCCQEHHPECVVPFPAVHVDGKVFSGILSGS